MRQNLLLLLLLTISGAVFAQGVTTSAITGKVLDESEQPLPGATVIAIHEPSGTQYGNVTDVNGFFRIPNMRVGGPYQLKIKFVGYDNYEKQGIYLELGRTLRLPAIVMATATMELENVIITADPGDVFDGNRTGAQTVIPQEQINATPTVSRAIGDFARLTPQASLEEGNDGFQISLAGMNNRLNAIYIDGAVNNDVFGLAGSGTNGGQTGVTPISVDAIEQFNIAIAPFDVRQSGFAGGAINAVTRSGSNEIEASAYYFFRNDNLAGVTPGSDEFIEENNIERVKLSEFFTRTYGLRIGGPIIKDKLFFFVSGEIERSETPQPFNIESYNGDATVADINNLVNFLETTYGYDPGPWNDNTAFLNSNKLLVKLDYNLNNKHKISLRHSITDAENLEARSSSSSGIQFRNGSEYFLSTTNSTALEITSSIANDKANKFIFGYTRVRDDRDPFGEPFPSVSIDDGRGGFTFGAEPFSTANQLNQDIFTLTNNFEIYKGKHTITIGTHNEFYNVYNLFMPFNYGNYDWSRRNPVTDSDLEDFMTGVPADFYIRVFSLRDNVTGDGSAAGVNFNSALWGLYVQDEYQANDRLRLNFGLRVDVPTFEDTPVNEHFNQNTIPLIESFYPTIDVPATGDFIEPQFMFSPRFGFNWDTKGDRSSQVRGGLGIFNSRVPLVWPGAAYNNVGVNTGAILRFGSQEFVADPFSQPPGEVTFDDFGPSGSIDIFSEDFKIPQVFKANLAIDQKLPGGIVGTLEGIYTKFLNNVYYQNLNLKPSTENLEGTPDDRPIFNQRDEIDDTYSRIILASNTDKGYAYNLTAQLTKPFTNGFTAVASYTYGDAYTIYDGTSSQNSSQWRGLHAVGARNFHDDLQRSDFAAGSRILTQLSYKKEWGGFTSSQLSLIYEGQSGDLVTYIYDDGDELKNEDTRNRALIYVPADASEINFIGTPEEQAAQWNALNDFIESNEYLSSRRGDYVERNASRVPFQHIIDLRFLQDFYIETGNGKRNTLQLSIDVFNFTNLLNDEWGTIYNGYGSGFELIKFEEFRDDTNIPLFSFEPVDDNTPWKGRFDDRGIRSSRWQMQVGLRYTFGN